tara:strand:- start:284 stop:397 length:114 start_codon:yes stop_codon:yes gene_type:complete
MAKGIKIATAAVLLIRPDKIDTIRRNVAIVIHLLFPT